MRRTRNQKGFTIMELMIVIVIIGILIAIAVPAYNAFRIKAENSACASNLRTIASAYGLNYAETGVHTDCADDAAIATLLVGAKKFLDAAVTCPGTEPNKGVYSIASGVVDCSIHPR